MSASKIMVILVCVAALVAAYWYWSVDGTNQENEATPEVMPDPVVLPKAPQPGPRTIEHEPTPVNQAGCLKVSQLEDLPELMQDVARIEEVSASGSTLDVYKFLDEATLHNFTEQGDSAAMLIVGARAVMRAFDKDQSQAISWLNHEQQIDDLYLVTGQLSPDAGLALNDAAYWFYESALHGRLLALQNYGLVRGQLFGGPVGLGWVSQEEFDALSLSEKNSLEPSNLYAQVAYDLAPALREGALGSLTRMVPQSDLQRAIRSEIVAEFEQTLSEAGLPPITVRPTATPEIEQLFDQVCESEIQEALRRRSLE